MKRYVAILAILAGIIQSNKAGASLSTEYRERKIRYVSASVIAGCRDIIASIVISEIDLVGNESDPRISEIMKTIILCGKYKAAYEKGVGGQDEI